MSAYADQITTTMEYLMDEIQKRLDNNEEVSTDDIKSMTISAFKKCAKEFEITETTVRDKCTRQMGKINTPKFYQLVKDSIGSKDLLNVIIKYAKSTDTAESITKELNSNLQ